MEQRDINSRTRADTFGLRPDLYDALSGNMVKKEDLGVASGTSGYGKFSTGKVSFPVAGGSIFGNPVASEISDLKGTHFGSCGWETWNNVNIPLSGAVIDSPGLWVCIPYFQADMTGTGLVGAQVGLATDVNSQSAGAHDKTTDYVNFSYTGKVGDKGIGASTVHVINVTKEQVDGGAGIYSIVYPQGGNITIIKASMTVFRLDSDMVF